MGETKDDAFAAIRDSIPAEFDDPSEDQQEVVKDLDKELRDQYGFDPKSKPSEEEKDDGRGPTKAAVVLAIVKTRYDRLFLDEYQIPHAAVTINGHLEIIPLRSKRFRSWIAGTVYRESQTVMDSQTIKDIVSVLSAEPEFNNEEPIKLDLRVGDRYVNNESRWYYDLTNKDWEFIEITGDYWKQVNNLIVFRRFPNQTPQVYPCNEYLEDIFDRFMNLLNINGEENRLLLKCYIVTMFIPNVPKVILMLHGEQGSAKTTLEELIKMIIDPSIVKTFAFPKDITEFIQQLSHSYVTYYDNISTIRDWVSDLLCRAVTGSGFSKRVLYTDDDDFIYSLKRCVGFNGINLGATKADLLDRGLIIQLERLGKDKWRKIEDIWKEFEEIRPKLLGYIFDIIVKVRAWKKEGKPLNLKGLSRMADWTEYAEIVSRCMGNEDEVFLKAYYKNINLQIEEVLESSPLAIAVMDFIACTKESSESPTRLLNLLEVKAATLGINIKDKFWPKSASHLSRKLKELVTTLREIGIEINWSSDSKTNTRTIIIKNVSYVPHVPPEKQDQARNSEHDDDNPDGRYDKYGTLLKTKPPERPPAYQ